MRTWSIQPTSSTHKSAASDHADLNMRLSAHTDKSAYLSAHTDKSAVPLSVRDEHAGPEMLSKRRPSRVFGGVRALAASVVWLFGLSVAWVMVDSFMPVPCTSLMGIRMIESVIDGKSPRFAKQWVSIDKMNSTLPAAVMAGEDTRFFEHNGFDFEAIQKAVEHNTQVAERAALRGSGLTSAKRSRLRGGSTITQQTAKNVFLWPSRSWVRKGVEVYFTALIELLWPKTRILEVYLNVVEWGDGIYGAEAAAQFYFHKPASRLSARESALLAAVLPNPLKFSVSHPSGYTLFREGTIRARMPITMQMIQHENRQDVQSAKRH